MKPFIFNKKSFLTISIILLGVFSIVSFSSDKNTTDVERTEKEKLDYFLTLADEIRQSANVPGVGLAIVQDKNVLYTGGLGFSNVVKKVPVSENTLFSIGSNTKAFTGAVASKLVEEGKMNWDTPLINYIPELELKEEYVARNVNLRDALNHISGLGRHDNVWKYKVFPRNEILNRVKDLDFASGFRQSFGYNNLMYTIAGIAMERATDTSWETLVQEKILNPLEMHDSYLTQSAFEKAPNRAIGYKADGTTPEKVVYLDHIAPAGSISATPKDMSKWIAMLINDGTYQEKTVLKENEYKFMMTAHDDIGFREPNQFWFYNAGIGGFMENGKRNLGHSGSIDGQNSFMVLRPDEGFAIFIMTNKLSGYKELIAQYAQNIFLNDNYERDVQAEETLKELVAFEEFRKALSDKDLSNAKAIHKKLNTANLESAMNQLGYSLLGDGKLVAAAFVLTQNTLDHPNSSNAFDSLGEYYFTVEDYVNALENYRNAMRLDNDNANARMMIQKINRLTKAESNG